MLTALFWMAVAALILLLQKTRCFNPELRPEKYLTISSTLNFTFKIRMNSSQPIYPGAKLFIDFSNSLIMPQEGNLNTCRFENIISPDLNVIYKDCTCHVGMCVIPITNKITDLDRFFNLFFGDIKNPPYLMDQQINIRLEYDPTGLVFDEIKNFTLPKSLFKQGDINLCTLLQNSYKVRETTIYTFSFAPSNKIFKKGKINILFPPEIRLSSTINVSVKLNDQEPPVNLSLTANPSDRLLLDTLFAEREFEPLQTRTVIVTVEGVKNPDVISSASISINTMTFENYLIDQALSAFYGKASEAGNINITIDLIGAPNNRIINSKSNLAFKINHQCTDNLKTLIITFPNSFIYLDNTYCDPAFGLFHNGCQRQGNVFSTDNFGVYSAEIEIDVFNIINPNSTKSCDFVVTFLNYDNLIFCQSTNIWHPFPGELKAFPLKRNSTKLSEPVELGFFFMNMNPFETGSFIKLSIPTGYYQMLLSTNLTIQMSTLDNGFYDLNYTALSFSKTEGTTILIPEWCSKWLGLNNCPSNSHFNFTIKSGIINPSFVQLLGLGQINVSILTKDREAMVDTFQGVLDVQPNLILDSLVSIAVLRAGSLVFGRSSSISISFLVKKFYFESSQIYMKLQFPSDVVLMDQFQLKCAGQIKEIPVLFNLECFPSYTLNQIGLPQLSIMEIKLFCDQQCFSTLIDTMTIQISLFNIRNPINPKPNPFTTENNYFSIEVRNFDNNSIAFTKLLEFATQDLISETIEIIKISSDSSFTGALTNLSFQFINRLELPKESDGGIIEIYIPPQIELDISNNIYCTASCDSQLNFLCKFNFTDRTIRVSHTESDLELTVGKNLSIKIYNVNNPISLRVTDKFTLSSRYNDIAITRGDVSLVISQNSPLVLYYANRSETIPSSNIEFRFGLDNFNQIPPNGFIYFCLPKDQVILQASSSFEYKNFANVWTNGTVDVIENEANYILIWLRNDCPCPKHSLFEARILNGINPPSEKSSDSVLYVESRDEWNYTIDKSLEMIRTLPNVAAGNVDIIEFQIDSPSSNTELSLMIVFKIQYPIPGNSKMTLLFLPEIFYTDNHPLACFAPNLNSYINCNGQLSWGQFGYSYYELNFESICGANSNCSADTVFTIKIDNLRSAPSTETKYSDWIIMTEHPEGGAINRGGLKKKSFSPSSPKPISQNINISRSSDIVSQEISLTLLYETDSIFTTESVLVLSFPGDYFEISNETSPCSSVYPCSFLNKKDENVLEASFAQICNQTSLCAGLRFILLKIENLKNQYFISETAASINISVKSSINSSALIEVGEFKGNLTLEPSPIEILEITNKEQRVSYPSEILISLKTSSYAGPGSNLLISIEGNFFAFIRPEAFCVIYLENDFSTKTPCEILKNIFKVTINNSLPSGSLVNIKVSKTINLDYIPSYSNYFLLIIEHYSSNNDLIAKGLSNFNIQKFLIVNTLESSQVLIKRSESRVGLKSILFLDIYFQYGIWNNSFAVIILPRDQIELQYTSNITCSFFNGYLYLKYSCVCNKLDEEKYLLQFFIDFLPSELIQGSFSLKLKLEGGKNPVIKKALNITGFLLKLSWNSFPSHESVPIYAFPELTINKTLMNLNITRESSYIRSLDQSYNFSFTLNNLVTENDTLLMEFPARLLYISFYSYPEVLGNFSILANESLLFQIESDQDGNRFINKILIYKFCKKSYCLPIEGLTISIINLKNPIVQPNLGPDDNFFIKIISQNFILAEAGYSPYQVQPQFQKISLVKSSAITRENCVPTFKTAINFNISLEYEFISSITVCLVVPIETFPYSDIYVASIENETSILNYQAIISPGNNYWEIKFEYRKPHYFSSLFFKVFDLINPLESENLSQHGYFGLILLNQFGESYSVTDNLIIDPDVRSQGSIRFIRIMRTGNNVNQDVEYLINFLADVQLNEYSAVNLSFPQSMAYSRIGDIKNLHTNDKISTFTYHYYPYDKSIKHLVLSNFTLSNFNISVPAKNPTSVFDAQANKYIEIMVSLNNGSIYSAVFNTDILPRITPGLITIVASESSSYRVNEKDVNLTYKLKTTVGISATRSLYLNTSEFLEISKIDCVINDPLLRLTCRKEANQIDYKFKISRIDDSAIDSLQEIEFIMTGFTNPGGNATIPLLSVYSLEKVYDNFYLNDELPYGINYSANGTGSFSIISISRSNVNIGALSDFIFSFKTENKVPKNGKINIEFDESDQAELYEDITCFDDLNTENIRNCSLEPSGRIILWDMCVNESNCLEMSQFVIKIRGLRNTPFSPILEASNSFKIFTSSYQNFNFIDVAQRELFAEPPVSPEKLIIRSISRTENLIDHYLDLKISLSLKYVPAANLMLIVVSFSKFVFNIPNQGSSEIYLNDSSNQVYLNDKLMPQINASYFDDNSISSLEFGFISSDLAAGVQESIIINLKNLKNVEFLTNQTENKMKIDIFTYNKDGKPRLSHSLDYIDLFNYISKNEPEKIFNLSVIINPPLITATANMTISISLPRPSLLSQRSVLVLKIAEEFAQNQSPISCLPIQGLEMGLSCSPVVDNKIFIYFTTSDQQDQTLNLKFLINNITNPSLPKNYTSWDLNFFYVIGDYWFQFAELYKSQASVTLVNFTNISSGEACSDPCYECPTEMPTLCISCKVPSAMPFLYISKRSCVSKCPQGTFLENYVCRDCADSCKECFGLDSTSCISCKTNLKYSSGRCLTVCPEGTHLSDDNLKCFTSEACLDPNCAACGKDGFICSKCRSPYYLLPEKGICEAMCPDGYYATADFICEKCEPPCSKCQNVSNECLECSNIYLEDPFLNLVNWKCENSCMEGTFLSVFNGLKACSACKISCKTCENKDSCLTCDTKSKTYSVYSYGDCIETCQDGFSLDIITYSCHKKCINPSCYRCEGDNNAVCTKCFKESDSIYNGTCYEIGLCPLGWYFDSFTEECRICSKSCLACVNSKDYCISCPKMGSKELYLFNNSCIEKCPSGYKSFLSEDGIWICTTDNCKTPCKTCGYNDNLCVTCLEEFPFLLKKTSVCIKECPEGTFSTKLSSGIQTCSACDYTCEKCTNDTSCTACDGKSLNFPLFAYGKCVQSCEMEGYVLDIEYNRCYKKCLNIKCHRCEGDSPEICTGCSGSFNISFNKSCYSFNEVPSGYYYNLKNNVFESCSETCRECNGPLDNNCISCSDAKNESFLYNGSCVFACPIGYAANNTDKTCKKNDCDNGCSLCSFDRICLECDFKTQYNYSGTCLSLCPYGTFPTYRTDTANSVSCWNCSYPCLSCQNKENNCTECSPDRILSNGTCLLQCPEGYFVLAESCEKTNQIQPTTIFLLVLCMSSIGWIAIGVYMRPCILYLILNALIYLTSLIELLSKIILFFSTIDHYGGILSSLYFSNILYHTVTGLIYKSFYIENMYAKKIDYYANFKSSNRIAAALLENMLPVVGIFGLKGLNCVVLGLPESGLERSAYFKQSSRLFTKLALFVNAFLFVLDAIVIFTGSKGDIELQTAVIHIFLLIVLFTAHFTQLYEERKGFRL